MAITIASCEELESRTISASFNRGEYNLVYKITVSGEDHPSEETVRQALPAATFTIGASTHPRNAQAYLETADLSRSNDSAIWLVDCRYATLQFTSIDNEEDEQRPEQKAEPVPWNRPVIRKLTTRATQEKIEQVWDGAAIDDDGNLGAYVPFVLSNGLPPTKAPVYTFRHRVFTFALNVADATFDYSVHVDPYLNRVNSDYIFPMSISPNDEWKYLYRVHCEDISAEEVYKDQYHYWKLIYTFVYRPWPLPSLREKIKVLNEHTQERRPDTTIDVDDPITVPEPVFGVGATPIEKRSNNVSGNGTILSYTFKGVNVTRDWPLHHTGCSLSIEDALDTGKYTYTRIPNLPRNTTFLPLGFDWPIVAIHP